MTTGDFSPARTLLEATGPRNLKVAQFEQIPTSCTNFQNLTAETVDIPATTPVNDQCFANNSDNQDET